MRNMKNNFYQVTLALTVGLCSLAINPLHVEAKPTRIATTTEQAPIQASNDDINKSLETLRNSLKTAKIEGASANDETIKNLVSDYEDLMKASNQHNIDNIIKHYNSHFMSGDNLSISELKGLVQDTWQTYPDIVYTSTITNIRVSGDYASIETIDTSSANTSGKESQINLPGKLSGESHNTVYYKRSGGDWEIVGDNTSWEQATVRYGAAKDINMTLAAPEQVKSGELYSVTFDVDARRGDFAVAAINNQELVYPNPTTDDKFRPVNSSNKTIQRVIRANSNNHNEIVSATIGIATINDNGNNDRPKLGLDGIATIVKRVNIIPISQAEMLKAMDTTKTVRTSANGKVNLNKVDIVNEKINRSAGLPQKENNDGVEEPTQVEEAPVDDSVK